MKGKWRKLFLILLLPIMLFFGGYGCDGLGNDGTTGYPFLVHFYLGTTDADVLEIAEQEIPNGGTVTRPKDPVWEDHFFEGWYKDMACTIPWNFAFDTVKQETFLYGKWLGQFTVSFNLHSINCIPVSITNKIVIENQLIDNVVTPELSGYRFDGWYLDAEYTEYFDVYNDTVTSNITLHAKWTKRK